MSGSLSWGELNELDQLLAKLQMQGWAHVDAEDIQVKPMNEVNTDEFPGALREVVQNILQSDEDIIVKRRALAILKNKLEGEL